MDSEIIHRNQDDKYTEQPAPDRWCQTRDSFHRAFLVHDHIEHTSHHDAIPSGVASHDVDVVVERLLVITSVSLEQLDEHCARLQAAGFAHGLELIPTDGYHHILVNRVTKLNQP